MARLLKAGRFSFTQIRGANGQRSEISKMGGAVFIVGLAYKYYPLVDIPEFQSWVQSPFDSLINCMA